MLTLLNVIGNISASLGKKNSMCLLFSPLAFLLHVMHLPSYCDPWCGTGALRASIVVDLDDGLCAMHDKESMMRASELVQSTLQQAGFMTNSKKSVWEPTQRLQWLGFMIDLAKGQLEVPEKNGNLKM